MNENIEMWQFREVPTIIVGVCVCVDCIEKLCCHLVINNTYRDQTLGGMFFVLPEYIYFG
jgi:hypothetical protein